jgi:hypothetical protein
MFKRSTLLTFVGVACIFGIFAREGRSSDVEAIGKDCDATRPCSQRPTAIESWALRDDRLPANLHTGRSATPAPRTLRLADDRQENRAHYQECINFAADTRRECFQDCSVSYSGNDAKRAKCDDKCERGSEEDMYIGYTQSVQRCREDWPH